MAARALRLLFVAVVLSLLATPLAQNISTATDASTPDSAETVGSETNDTPPPDIETTIPTATEPTTSTTPWTVEVTELSGDCLGNVTALVTTAQETNAMLEVLDASIDNVLLTEYVVIPADVPSTTWSIALPENKTSIRYRLLWMDSTGTLNDALSETVPCGTSTPEVTQSASMTNPAMAATSDPAGTPETSGATIGAAADATFISDLGGVDFTFSTSDGSALPSGYELCVDYSGDQCVAVAPGTQTLTNLYGETNFLLKPSSDTSQQYGIDPLTVYVVAGINVPASVVLNHYDTGSVTFNLTTDDGGPLPDPIIAYISYADNDNWGDFWDWRTEAMVENGTVTFPEIREGQHSYWIDFWEENPGYHRELGTFEVSAGGATTVNVVLRSPTYSTFEFDITTSDGGELDSSWEACVYEESKGDAETLGVCAPVGVGITQIEVPDTLGIGAYSIHTSTGSYGSSDSVKYQSVDGEATLVPNEIQHIPVVLQRRTGTSSIVLQLDTSDSSAINPNMVACVYSNYDNPAPYSLCLPYDGGDITFPGVEAGDYQLSVEHYDPGTVDPSPYERVDNQLIHVNEGQTVTISQTLIPILYGNVDVTILTDDGSIPPDGYKVCIGIGDECKYITQTGVPIPMRAEAGPQTLSVRYDGFEFIQPYDDFSTVETVTANETLQITFVLNRIPYIPVHVSITDTNGSPITDPVAVELGYHSQYFYEGSATVWVEAGFSYYISVDGGARYRDTGQWINVPSGVTEYPLAFELEAYSTGTFTLTLPSGLPAPSSNNSPSAYVVTLNDDTYKSDFVPLTNGSTGPITWRSGDVDYSNHYITADDGDVWCEGTFTNAVGGNIVITMDCTFTPAPVPNPPGTANPSFTGSKQAITNSASTPNTGTSSRAYDGNTATTWATGATKPAEASLRFDLGSAKPVTGVKWRFGAIGQADSFTVNLVSASGTVLQTYGPYGNGSSTGAFYGVAVPTGITARFVHFVFTNLYQDTTLGGISEVELWGSTSTTTNPPGTSNPSFSGALTTITNAFDTPNTGTAGRVKDGNIGSNWAVGNSPSTATLTLDLGSVQSLTGIKWLFAYSGYADKFTIRLSTTYGGAATTIGPFGNAPAAYAWFGTNTTASARFVQFVFENPSGDPALGSVGEIQVFRAVTTNPPGTVNPSFAGSKASVSNVFDSLNTGTSSRVLDGASWSNFATSATTPATVTVTLDLGAPTPLSGVRWMWSSMGYADQFEVRLSTAYGGASTSLGTFGNGTATGTWFGASTTTSARFVQFVFTNPNRDAALGALGEVEIWKQAATVNPSGTANPPVSGLTKRIFTNVFADPASTNAKNATDGVTWSNWASPATKPTSASLTADLGSVQPVTVIRWQMPNLGYADKFTVRIATTYGAWTTIGTFGNPGATYSWYGLTLPNATDVRFVQLLFANPNGDAALGSVGEIELWGSSTFGAAVTASPGQTDLQLTGQPLPLTCTADPTSASVPSVCDAEGGTAWQTDPTTPAQVILTITLPDAVPVSGIKWNVAQAGMADQFTVAYANGATLTEVGTFAGGQPGVYEGVELPGEPIADRIILTFPNIGNDPALGGLAEVEVWSLAGTDGTPVASPDAAAPEVSPDSGTPEPEIPVGTPDAGTPFTSPTVEASPVAETPTEEAPASPVVDEPTSEPTATSEPTSAPTDFVALTGTITGTGGDLVNCRNTAPDGETITQLAEGTTVTVTGEPVEGWVPLLCEDLPGFVSEQFITIGETTETPVATEPADGTPASETPTEVTETATVAVTEEPTLEPTEEPVETSYVVYDAGDTEDSGVALLATDDDLSTYWSVYPGISPEQTRLYVDLGSVVPIDRLSLVLSTWDQLPYFEVWLSEDADTWYNATPDGINGWNLPRDEAITISLGYDARYIRIVIPNVDESGLSEVGGIAELAFWPGEISQTSYVSSLGSPTTPTPETIPTEMPTEDVVETEPVEDVPVEEEPTVEVIPTEEVFPTEEPTVEPEWEEPIPTEAPVPEEGDGEAVG